MEFISYCRIAQTQLEHLPYKREVPSATLGATTKADVLQLVERFGLGPNSCRFEFYRRYQLSVNLDN